MIQKSGSGFLILIQINSSRANAPEIENAESICD